MRIINDHIVNARLRNLFIRVGVEFNQKPDTAEKYKANERLLAASVENIISYIDDDYISKSELKND